MVGETQAADCRRVIVQPCLPHIGESGAVYTRNREPSLDELLDDPIARLVMASDRLQVEDVIFHLDVVRRRLATSRALGTRRRQGWTRR
jgi:hypothetical protein